jgi:putative heme iron utilization protein
VRRLLEAERHAALATLSASHNGWPFASVVAYALNANGEPLLLLSDLAEHTRNLRVDARASLLVQDSKAREDPQAGARVTLLGAMYQATEADAQTRYVERHPSAGEYLALGDFHLWVLRVSDARFIGGFGTMRWVR